MVTVADRWTEVQSAIYCLVSLGQVLHPTKPLGFFVCEMKPIMHSSESCGGLKEIILTYLKCLVHNKNSVNDSLIIEWQPLKTISTSYLGSSCHTSPLAWSESPASLVPHTESSQWFVQHFLQNCQDKLRHLQNKVKLVIWASISCISLCVPQWPEMVLLIFVLFSVPDH